VESFAEDALRRVSEPIVPVEVVGPPLPMERLGEVNRLIALREAGARGTGDEPGLRLRHAAQPGAAGHRRRHRARYLQAFLCLEDWLRERARWT
jgi:hypothetical protein